MPGWAWILIVMVIVSIIAGAAGKSGRRDVAKAAQGTVDLGWIILLLAVFGVLGSLLSC